MAELPRYRPLGAAIPSVPTVDFVSTGRAQARVYENISRGLDIMQRYVSAKEEAKTKFEAQQWAYDQDLSAEQLEAALSAGRSIEEIVGDPTTVFGSMSVATTAAKLKTELEAGLRSQLAALSAKVDGGADINLGAEIAAINGVQAGHTELLSQLDPVVANAFSATVATLAAPVYSKALEREISMGQAILKSRGLDAMAGSQDAFEDIYRADKGGETQLNDMDGTPRAVILQTEGQADKLQQLISDQLIATNDANFAQTEMAKFDAIRKTAKINVLASYAIELPPEKIMSALRTGDFGDKTKLFNTLDETGKADLRKQVRNEVADRQSVDDQARKDNALKARQDSVTNVLAFLSMPDGSNESNDAIYELATTAVLFPEVIDGQGIAALMKSKQTIQEGNYFEEEMPQTVFDLRSRINAGQIIGYAELQKAANELGLGPKQTLSLAPYLDSTQNRINNDVEKEARIHSGLITGMINVTAKKAKQTNSFIANVQQRYDDAVTNWEANGETGDRPNKAIIAKEYRLELASSDFQKQIDQTIATLGKRYPSIDWNEDITTADVESNKDAWGLTSEDVRKIGNYISLIEKNIQLRDEL